MEEEVQLLEREVDTSTHQTKGPQTQELDSSVVAGFNSYTLHNIYISVTIEILLFPFIVYTSVSFSVNDSNRVARNGTFTRVVRIIWKKGAIGEYILSKMSVTTITSQDQINKLSNSIVVLNFWADWSKQCEQTNEVFKKLAQKYTSLVFGQVEAEKVPDVTEKYSVLSVPFFVFLRVSF